MKRLIIKSLSENGEFGIADYKIQKEDHHIFIESTGQECIVRKGAPFIRKVKEKTKFSGAKDFYINMYKLPVIAREENQMRLF